MDHFLDNLTINPTNTTTSNGMQTNVSSLSACVDLFFHIGASRNNHEIVAQFENAYQEDRVIALRTAAWARDIRGGAGERNTFRKILNHIEIAHPADLPLLIPLVPEFGRWDDLLVFDTKHAKNLAFTAIQKALIVDHDQLCAKWCPRKGVTAAELRKFMGLSPKSYRKTLVNLTNVVETAMCAGQWDSIDYGKLPSIAAARYQTAFGRHSPERYEDYKIGLKDGTQTVNTGALYPYDVVRALESGDAIVAQAQWDGLENFLGDQMILPMVDVSGSMTCRASGSVSCLDVAVSLGLYISEKNKGAFQNKFITFAERPCMQTLSGSLEQRLNQLKNSDWDMSTNLESAFSLLLAYGKKNQLTSEEMPKYLLILSDMEFNIATDHKQTAHDMAQQQYRDAGYDFPNVVFWNLNATRGNVPVTINDSGVALVSGFSPSILKSVLKAENMDPVSIMLDTINAPRYQTII